MIHTINFKHSVEIRPLKSYSDLDLEATMLNIEIISAIFVYYNILKTVIMMLLSVKLGLHLMEPLKSKVIQLYFCHF